MNALLLVLLSVAPVKSEAPAESQHASMTLARRVGGGMLVASGAAGLSLIGVASTAALGVVAIPSLHPDAPAIVRPELRLAAGILVPAFVAAGAAALALAATGVGVATGALPALHDYLGQTDGEVPANVTAARGGSSTTSSAANTQSARVGM